MEVKWFIFVAVFGDGATGAFGRQTMSVGHVTNTGHACSHHLLVNNAATQRQAFDSSGHDQNNHHQGAAQPRAADPRPNATQIGRSFRKAAPATRRLSRRGFVAVMLHSHSALRLKISILMIKVLAKKGIHILMPKSNKI